MADDDDDNFLSRFKGGFEDAHEEQDSNKDPSRIAFSQRTARSNFQALLGSSEKPLCRECGREDEENGGGRYGVDDHEGLFYCGRCWRAWDANEKDAIMKPLWQQKKDKIENIENVSDNDIDAEIERLEERLRYLKMLRRKRKPDKDNFFDMFKARDHEGTDDIEGAWDPSKKTVNERGEQALPGSWERPICVECGNDEGEEGGGRYGHGDDCKNFFCGRCWKSWDAESQRKMMMAYAPVRGMDLMSVPPPCEPMDPMDFDNDPGAFEIYEIDEAEEYFEDKWKDEEIHEVAKSPIGDEFVD